MKNRWNSSPAPADDIASLLHASRLLGSEPDLALHGGGNTSVKGMFTNRLGEERPTLFVKASGVDLGAVDAGSLVALDLERMRKIATLAALTDEELAEEFSASMLRPRDSRPSVEGLMHALLDEKFVAHTHPSAILALTNRTDAEAALSGALGTSVAAIPYARVGLELARAVHDARIRHPAARGVVIMHHGLVTWGTTAQQACTATVEVVTAAEEYLSSRGAELLTTASGAPDAQALQRYRACAPILRGLLGVRDADSEFPVTRTVLAPLLDAQSRAIIDSRGGRQFLVSAPLTPDYLIRTHTLPVWIDAPSYDDPEALRGQFRSAVDAYVNEYGSYLKRHGGQTTADLLPRVAMLPGLGAVCVGHDAASACMVRDITEQSLRVKKAILDSGGSYHGLAEDHLFNMEYRSLQRAKLGEPSSHLLSGAVALVTGAAGAIGSGVCEFLLVHGAHVAVTDLPGAALDNMAAELAARHSGRVLAVGLDVTDPASVETGFGRIVQQWGGIDLVVVNAGIAHVCPLADMDIEAFRNLERVNVEGTLLLLRQAARHFKVQAMGGDVVLVSTKNVFAPGARFGAYSATKAASHQLARIASLELADIGVRVNMVAPDAVFSHGAKRSGLWAAVGPDRMKARGLDEKGLEEYYQSRNLLKARVTSEHVARAVLYFATRQTPTTGATIPVDGGLPDATPR